MSVPIDIEIPPTLASLCVAIDSTEVPSDVGVAIQRGQEAIAAYDNLRPEQRAAYIHAIRNDIQMLNGKFDDALRLGLNGYAENRSPETAIEVAHLAVQAGEVELGQRFLRYARQLGAGDDVSPEVQERVAEIPPARVPLSAELATTGAPPDARDLNLIGLERLALQDTEGAKAAFETAVDLDPNDPEHLNNLALTQVHSGLIRQAAEGAIRALEMKPELSPANLVLATACLQHAVAWAKERETR